MVTQLLGSAAWDGTTYVKDTKVSLSPSTCRFPYTAHLSIDNLSVHQSTTRLFSTQRATNSRPRPRRPRLPETKADQQVREQIASGPLSLPTTLLPPAPLHPDGGFPRRAPVDMSPATIMSSEQSHVEILPLVPQLGPIHRFGAQQGVQAPGPGPPLNIVRPEDEEELKQTAELDEKGGGC